MKASQWDTVSLGDVVDEITVGHVGTMSSEYVVSGIPFLRSKNVLPYKISFEDIKYITPEFHARLKKSSLCPGDVVVVRTGKPGTTAVIPTTLSVSNCSDLVIIRPGTKVNPRFLAYFFNVAALHHVSSHLVGAVQQHFNVESARKMRLALPPKEQQDWIADIAGTLDDKIELNRRMNETLESMARRLFKSWFVDFDPVHAKAAVRREHPNWPNDRISREALPKLDPKIADLFPNEFEESALGPIPKGWRVTKLIEHTEAARGLSYKGSGLTDSGLPMHNLNSVYEGGGYKFEGMKYYAGEYMDRHLVTAGEVIVANTEQGHQCLLLGYAAVVPSSFGLQGLFSHHTYRLRIREGSPLTRDFLCRLLNSLRMHDLVSGFGNGTTVNMLPIAGVEQPDFVVPDEKLIDAYSRLAADIRAREERFVTENQDLARTRDRLLPKLLSGELRPPLSARKLGGGHE